MVLNTCVVRQGAEDKATSYLHMIKPLKQQRPNMIVGVMGCLVGVRGNSPLRKAFPWVDVFMAPSEPAPMVDFLLQKEARRACGAGDAPSDLRCRTARLRARVHAPLPFVLPAHEIGNR